MVEQLLNFQILALFVLAQAIEPQECFALSFSIVCAFPILKIPPNPRLLASCSTSSSLCRRISTCFAISSSLCFISYYRIKDTIFFQTTVCIKNQYQETTQSMHSNRRNHFEMVTSSIIYVQGILILKADNLKWTDWQVANSITFIVCYYSIENLEHKVEDRIISKVRVMP